MLLLLLLRRLCLAPARCGELVVVVGERGVEVRIVRRRTVVGGQGGRWLLHVGGSRGLLPGLESATAKISGSGRSGVPPNMSTWCIPSGVARGAAQPEHDMARPALQHHPTHGARARSRRCRKTHTCPDTKIVRHARFWGLGRAQWADPGPRGWKGCLGSASAPGQCPTALALLRPKWRRSAAQLPAGRLDAKS